MDFKALITGFLIAIIIVLVFNRVVSFYDVPQFPSTIEGITKIYTDEVERLSKEMDTRMQVKPEDREKFAQELANSMEVLNNAYNMAVMAIPAQQEAVAVQ
jgi:hypothetical protein